MTVDELSRLAYSGTPPDSAMPYEWLLWYRLRDIYEWTKAGIRVEYIDGEWQKKGFTKDDGAEQKEQAVNSYQTDKTLHDASVKLWTRIEDASVRYAKEHTIEAADGLYEALYRMKPGLPERLKRNGHNNVETSANPEQSQETQNNPSRDGTSHNEATQPERAVK